MLRPESSAWAEDSVVGMRKFALQAEALAFVSPLGYLRHWK